MVAEDPIEDEEDAVKDDMEIPAEEDPPEASGDADEESAPDDPKTVKDEKENYEGVVNTLTNKCWSISRNALSCKALIGWIWITEMT